AEEPIDQVAHELSFGAVGGDTRPIDMAAILFLSDDETFFGHDLEEAENGRVTEWFRSVLVQLRPGFADGARPSFPQHAHEGELAVRRAGWLSPRGEFTWHGRVLRKIS